MSAPFSVTHAYSLRYYTIIHNPMNLKEIKAKLHDGFYASRDEIKRDLYLIAANAKEYNRDGRGGDAIWLMADMYEKNLTQSESPRTS